MKRTCVLLSTIVLAIGVATCPHLMSVNAAATTFEDTEKKVEKSADSANLETKDVSVSEGTSGVDPNAQQVDNWILNGNTSTSTNTTTSTSTATATATSTSTSTNTSTGTSTFSCIFGTICFSRTEIALNLRSSVN